MSDTFSDAVFASHLGDRAEPEGPEGIQEFTETRSTLDLVRDNFSHDTLTGNLVEWLKTSSSDAQFDAEFTVDEQLLKDSEAEGIRPEHLDDLAASPNPEFFEKRKARILEHYQLQKELQASGSLGTGIQLTNALVDPASWALAIGTGGASKLETVSRVGRIGRGALQAGASEAVVASATAGLSVTYDWEDAALSTGAGFLLGGTLSSFGRTQHSGMTPSESVAFDNAVSSVVRKAQEAKGFIAPASGSGGAARVATKEVQSHASMDRLYDALDEDPAFSFDLKVGKKSLRFDLQGALGQSKHPMVRGTRFARDSAGKEGGAVNPYSASEWKTREVGVSEGRYVRATKPIKDAFRDSMGWKFLTPSRERAFNEDVGRAVRDRSQAPTEYHAKAADAAANEFREILQMAKETGVKGFENIKPRDTYLPRIYNRDKFLRAEQAYGTEGLKKFIAGAIRSGSGDVAAEEIDTVADAYVQTLRSLRVRDNSPLWSAQGAEASRDNALEVLQETLGEQVDPDVLDDVFELMVPSQKESGGARTKRRLVLDETFAGDVFDKHGKATLMRLDDLLENDVEALLSSYRNQVVGQSALAREGFSSRSDFDKLVQDIRNTAEEVEGYSRAEMEADLKRMDFLYNHVAGVPNHQTSEATRQWTDRILKYNFARVMNKTGFAQASELMLMVNHAGFQSLVEGVPLLKQYLKKVKTGEAMDDEMMNLVEQVWGFGTKTMRGQSLSRFVDVEGALERGGVTKLDDALHVASNVTAIGSGLGPLTDGMQLITARAAIAKWAKVAHEGGEFMSKDRLAHLGVDEAMSKRIEAQLKAQGTYKGMRGQDLPKIALSDWTDMQAKDAFIAAVDRHTRRVIQENDIGQLAGFMTHPLARIMLQFRGFSIGSYTNHLLYAANMKDSMAVREMFSTMFGGLMGYSAAVYASSIGRADREEYLEKRLNSKAAAAAMVYRSSHASFLPGGVDMAAQAMGFDPIFGHARNTGLSTDALFSNPTTDLAFSAVEGLGGTARAIVDPNYDFSQDQFDALTRTMMFQNALGIQNILNITKAELPESP